jgi:hypothetical protein
VGDHFLAQVPDAVQLARANVNPKFLRKPPVSEELDDKVTVDTRKAPTAVDREKERKEKLKKMPGWIPTEIFKSMTKEEIGKWACPWFIKNSTCTKEDCPYVHSKSKPLCDGRD